MGRREPRKGDTIYQLGKGLRRHRSPWDFDPRLAAFTEREIILFTKAPGLHAPALINPTRELLQICPAHGSALSTSDFLVLFLFLK